MAKMPAPAPAPMPAPADAAAGADAGAADAGADGADPDADQGNSPTTLCTVMDNHDGTFTLMKGDADAGAGDGTDMTGGAAPGEGGEGAGAADQGETFDSPGALLKAILDMLKESQDGGDGSAQDNFTQGFAGGAAASPPKPAPMAQKY